MAPRNRTVRTSSAWRHGVLALALTLGPLIVFTHASAQEAWLFVPVFEGTTPQPRPLDSLLSPWEQALPRVAQNRKAAEIYETRRSGTPAQLPEGDRTKLTATINAALEHLALGELQHGRQMLESYNALPEIQRDSLLQHAELAQKLFHACLLQAHLLMRERRVAEADQQLANCARDHQLDAPAQRANSVAVHGPPHLQAAFEKARAKRTAEASGRLTVESTQKNCSVFINGLAAGETPLHASLAHGESARVQLVCRNTPGRIHRVTVGRGERPVPPVKIDVRFDTALSTQDALQLRYADASDRDAYMESDGRTLLRALGVDRVALLVGHPHGQAWQFELTILDGNRPGTQNLGAIGFSEAAGYEPERLRQLSALLLEASERGNSVGSHEGASVALTPRATATASVADPTPERLDSPRHLPTVGVAIGAIGLIGVAGSWALFAERRSFRLRNRDEVSVADEAAYARRGAWSVLAGGLGASLLAVSPYFWLPDAPGLRPVAWAVGGVGLAVAALGIVTAFGDEHCGPERGGELREPCRSVRADALFGVELALTAAPFAALPLTWLLRDLLGTESVSVSAALQRDGIFVHAALPRL